MGVARQETGGAFQGFSVGIYTVRVGLFAVRLFSEEADSTVFAHGGYSPQTQVRSRPGKSGRSDKAGDLDQPPSPLWTAAFSDC